MASFCAMNDATVSAQGIAKLIGFGISLGSLEPRALPGRRRHRRDAYGLDGL